MTISLSSSEVESPPAPESTTHCSSGAGRITSPQESGDGWGERCPYLGGGALDAPDLERMVRVDQPMKRCRSADSFNHVLELVSGGECAGRPGERARNRPVPDVDADVL